MEKENEEQKSSFSEWITSPQMLVALSAVLLSLCGLFISIYETSLIRQQQRASVWPNVEISPSLNTNELKILVQNTGIGPSRIQAASVSYNGKIKQSWGDVIRSIAGDDQIPSGYQSLINGRVLPPNSDAIKIFGLTADNDSTMHELIYSIRMEIQKGNFDVNLCYCSVYDECWTASMQDVVKRFAGEEVLSREERRVESCRAADKSGI